MVVVGAEVVVVVVVVVGVGAEVVVVVVVVVVVDVDVDVVDDVVVDPGGEVVTVVVTTVVVDPVPIVVVTSVVVVSTVPSVKVVCVVVVRERVVVGPSPVVGVEATKGVVTTGSGAASSDDSVPEQAAATTTRHSPSRRPLSAERRPVRRPSAVVQFEPARRRVEYTSPPQSRVRHEPGFRFPTVGACVACYPAAPAMKDRTSAASLANDSRCTYIMWPAS